MTVLDYFCSIGNGCVEYDLKDSSEFPTIVAKS